MAIFNRFNKGCLWIFCASIIVTACSPIPTRQATPLETLGAGEGRLNIIAWDGYVERGENDPKVDWVTDFEKTTGCQIEVKTASSSDEMAVLMSQPGYDLVTAPSDVSTRLIDGGMVQPINVTLIPSWNSVDARLANSPWHTVNGVHYGIPFVWNVNRLLYEKGVFSNPPSSLGLTFEEQNLPDGYTNSGRVQAYEGAMAIADAALYLMETRPELGIRDPYELDRDQFRYAIELLREQRALISNYWRDIDEQIATFPYDGSAVSVAWPYQVEEFKRKGYPVDSLILENGMSGRADTLMLHSNAPHPNCAYQWMEYLLDPVVQADVSAWSGANPSVSGVCQTDNPLGEDGCRANGYYDFDKVYFWRTPMAECGDGALECVPYSEWVSAYISIVGGN